MKRIAALLLGIPFGFVIAWTGMNDPDVIRKMMLLENFYLYEVFAVAVAVGLAGSLLLRQSRLRALVTREPIHWETARPQRRHIVGSLVFGCGWAITSSCPGPIATQFGSGLWWSGVTIAGIFVGIAAFLLQDERRRRRQTETARSEPVQAVEIPLTSP
jgi:uncharacterized membrane protein YedE/YeeE